METKDKKSVSEKEMSRNVSLRKLKTKAWAWAAAYSLSTSKQPLKAYSLSKAADRLAISNDMAANNDPKNWKSRMEGKQGANKTTVTKLWPHLKNFYLVGPWEDGSDHPNNKIKPGGFVPLWSAITESSYEKILEDWNKVTLQTWIEWAPLSPDHEKVKNGAYIPTHGMFRNIIDLEKFLLMLAQAKDNVPPLLALAATLTVAKIHKDEIVFLFEPPDSAATVTHPSSLRDKTLKHLEKIHITIREIDNIARCYGLIIIDSVWLSKKEYKRIRYCHFTKRPSAFLGTSSITPVIYVEPLPIFSNKK